MAIIFKNKAAVQAMRESGRLAQRLLEQLGEAAQVGTTPRQLDALARRFLEQHGATSPFLGAKNHGAPAFPAYITVSVNEAVVHGIPGDRAFKDGDVVSLDVGALLNGYIGDTAGTYAVGTLEARAERLVRVTQESLYLGIAQAKVNNSVGDIAWAVQSHIENHGYSVVRELVGHGVGRELHEEPSVPNFGKPGEGARLRAGMTIAIEPMVNEGTAKVRCLADKWTYVTADGSLSAHFEHTIAILSDGPEILTDASN